MTEKHDEPPPVEHRPNATMLAVEGDRTAWEREFVHLACVGSNDEFRAAVERLSFRGSLKLVYNSAPESTVGPDDDVDTFVVMSGS